MKGAFLETSALIEWCFGDKATKDKICAALPEAFSKQTSRLAIFELGRGYLRNLILLHNKSLLVSGFSELLDYANASRFASHRMGTILGVLSQFFRSSGEIPAKNDAELLSLVRGFLRRLIRQGWAKATSSEFNILNQPNCRSDLPDPKQSTEGDYEHHLPKMACGSVSNCGLKAYYNANRGDFRRVCHQLKPPIDQEVQNRIAAIEVLVQKPTQNFILRDCVCATDATLVMECPKASVFVSKNRKHQEPIAKTLSRTSVFY